MNMNDCRQFERLLEHAVAENDNVLYQLLQTQTYHPKDWSEFLVDVVLTQSLVNRDLREQLVDALSKRPAPPIYMVGGQQLTPDGSWAGDHVDFTPDGAWPLVDKTTNTV